MKLFRIALTVIFVALLASCAGPTATPQTIVVTKEVIKEVEKEGPIEIAVIVKTSNSSFWQNVQTGAFAAQAELKEKTPKLSVTFLGAQSESHINEQINIV